MALASGDVFRRRHWGARPTAIGFCDLKGFLRGTRLVTTGATGTAAFKLLSELSEGREDW